MQWGAECSAGLGAPPGPPPGTAARDRRWGAAATNRQRSHVSLRLVGLFVGPSLPVGRADAHIHISYQSSDRRGSPYSRRAGLPAARG